MAHNTGENHLPFLLFTGLLAWIIPGAGHYLIGEKRRAAIIFATITITFCIGIYIGSIGVINPVGAKPWYVAQIMNTPLVAILGKMTAEASYTVYGWPNEIGQIYTSIAGLLNLLCIVNAVYVGYLKKIGTTDE